jgi:hypothetical protein
MEGFDPDTPIAGLYRARLVQGGVYVGVRIWFGPPHDPVTGEQLDRSWRWQATANGELIPLDRVWPRYADKRIDQAEYDYLVAMQRWGEAHAPDSPQANPRRKINLLTAPLPF